MWGAVAQVGMGLLGELLAGKSEAEQQRLMQQALDEFGNINLPALEKVLAEEQGASAFEGVRADPELISRQKEALGELERLYRSGGMTLADRANLADVQRETAGTERTSINRLRDELAATGRGGGGSELAMTLQAGSRGADRLHRAGLQTAADAQKRALDAMLEGGRLAGSMRSQGFDEESRKAAARDEVARFNAAARERAGMYNAQLPQQQFANQMNRAAGRSNQLGRMAGLQGQRADSTRQLWGGAGLAANEALRQRKRPEPGYSPPPLVNADDEDEWDNPFGYGG